MHDRYPAPNAQYIFSLDKTIERWRGWTDAYAHHSMVDLGDNLHTILDDQHTPTPEAVRTREADTGHDVVAFLSVYTQDMPDHLKRHIHRGLTSSDLVENAHFEALRMHAKGVSSSIRNLRAVLAQWQNIETYRVGRTHGQIAAPTSWNHQMRVRSTVLIDLEREILDYAYARILKSPGPTGVGGDVQDRARKINQYSVIPSTQIIPRDFQLRWAALYLRLACVLEDLALQVRLGSRTEVQEVRERAADSRVGSSAMPHKKNPITAEKICGLARVARGYFSTIAENVAFWEDRDLTNSSVERIVVPDMAAVVEYMLTTTTNLFDNIELDYSVMQATLGRANVYTALAQSLLQKHAGLGPIEASATVRGFGTRDAAFHTYLRQMAYNWMKDNRDDDLARAWLDEWDKEMQPYLH